MASSYPCPKCENGRIKLQVPPSRKGEPRYYSCPEDAEPPIHWVCGHCQARFSQEKHYVSMILSPLGEPRKLSLWDEEKQTWEHVQNGDLLL